MKFSIILPTINRPSLEMAVESVYAQRHRDWKLYIIGDGVVPNIRNYDKDKVHLLKTDKRYADSGTTPRNLGIRFAGEPWIAFLDDDDIFYPDHLSTIVSLHDKNPNANLFKTSAQEMIYGKKSPRHKTKTVRKLRGINVTDPLTITMAFSREMFFRTRGWTYDEHKHDHILYRELLAAGAVLERTDHVTVIFLR